jgi:hypothetical protein
VYTYHTKGFDELTTYRCNMITKRRFYIISNALVYADKYACPIFDVKGYNGRKYYARPINKWIKIGSCHLPKQFDAILDVLHGKGDPP